MAGIPSGSREVRHVTVPSDHAGRRIDNFLAGLLKGIPKSRLYRMLRSGEVRVNGGRVHPDYRLRAGDRLRIPPLRLADGPAKVLAPDGRLGKLIEEAVLYEDESLIVLNKPSGMPVHGGTGLKFGVIELLRGLRGAEAYLELVHRLDRGTSGCLMIAKQPQVLRQLHELLRAGAMDKRYLALLQGRWSGSTRTIQTPLRRDVYKAGVRKVEVGGGGKMALTHITPLDRFDSASLVQVRLCTGRTHQIRVHAAHIGHPVAGDPTYGEAAFNRLMRGFGLRHVFLHAQGLEFRLEPKGPRVTVAARLPEDLAQVLLRLRAEAQAARGPHGRGPTVSEPIG